MNALLTFLWDAFLFLVIVGAGQLVCGHHRAAQSPEGGSHGA